MSKFYVVPAEDFEAARKELKQLIEDTGGCDHSVGICCCDLADLVARLEKLRNPVDGITSIDGLDRI